MTDVLQLCKKSGLSCVEFATTFFELYLQETEETWFGVTC